MKFTPTSLPGAFVVDIEPACDNRGFFARFFCEKEFAAQGLETRFVQMSTSWNEKKGTLRGMHFQRAPATEVKIVRCVRGELHDVILDLRKNSPTFGQSYATTLSAQNRRMVYIPAGFAHGFVTLSDDCEIVYMMSAFHAPEKAAGLRYNDPRFALEWPLQPTMLSDQDRAWPDFNEKDCLL